MGLGREEEEEEEARPLEDVGNMFACSLPSLLDDDVGDDYSVFSSQQKWIHDSVPFFCCEFEFERECECEWERECDLTLSISLSLSPVAQTRTRTQMRAGQGL